MFINRCHLRVCRKRHKSITYGANGALLTDGLLHYAYDSEGRLAAASLGWANTSTTDDSITKYAHNSQAQRVFKTAPLYAVTNPEPTATPELLALFATFFESLWAPCTNPDGSTVQKAGMSYVYDEDCTLIADTLTGGATTIWGQSARYIHLPTASGPMPVAAIYGTKHYAIESDHLNTPSRLVQSDGQVAWQWAYSAFGDEQPTVASNRFANTALNQSFGTTTVAAVTFNLRYPGQYFDQESNLHYNYHRSYSAAVGRYTQSDPIGLDGGWNRFGYVGQNPLSSIDPTGLIAGVDDIMIIGVCAIVGTAIAINSSRPQSPNWINDPAAVAAHEEAKTLRCQPPPPDLVGCALLRWKRARNAAALALYIAWDATFLVGRHANDIINLQRSIKNLDEEIEKKCKDNCP
jgi:RHS repeat-associated protein